MLRSDGMPDALVSVDKPAESWESLTVQKIDEHIRMLLATKRWLIEEQKRKAPKP